MLDRFPPEILENVLEYLGQEEKVSLTYVSRILYKHSIPSLYRHLLLNDCYYFPCQLDPTIGTRHWSVLYLSYNYNSSKRKELANRKYLTLIRSLESNPEKLCPLIYSLHLEWHINDSLLSRFLKVIIDHAVNLKSVENFIKKYIGITLMKNKSNLESLNLFPPDSYPVEGGASPAYFNGLRGLLKTYSFDHVKNLNVHVNCRTFFKPLKNPLKIESLCLNLRHDTFDTDPLATAIRTNYYDIFDVDTLKELEILSWYSDGDTDWETLHMLYDLWGLRDFGKFNNIENFTILQLLYNEQYLTFFLKSFHNLKRVKLDYLDYIDGTFVKSEQIDLLGRLGCSKSLRYIDLHMTKLEPKLLEIHHFENLSVFEINMSCKCSDCGDTLKNVILKKYFPTKDTFTVNGFSHLHKRDFFLQIFKLFPIFPYYPFVDSHPTIGYNSMPLNHHVEGVNKLLNYEPNDVKYITEQDIIKIYHAMLHSMRKSFDSFLQKFPNLEYLILNGVATKVLQVDEHQRCNMPLFYCNGYKSNQVYELVSDSLFD
ncbi:hypothetical protein Kpol_543p53 [Vanderwaltozyma polyspora DSM 70294]|uniref:F-box domain-containing protein n=1 Tax=Vanderwaltozyma polyspora (strain ATCC 22028 / DSM 70294 / BCRC 21397 / CBS 2163 / NBRC 10782 / NRRL Y-8283 / UCD 57-17) TaxID=436907 RepID=A7THQ7_VANPO|nr:uncharacterized protein Kpol_543p53 [Vanderwaltozyma polyspora DSM 70294]EDO18223.1 hypothetical protein Kpol_543p53 [Vanderwaltozyma polyspora DSM 70294]